MLALIRQLMKFFEKEHQLVLRYEKSHPHFFWFLGLDAVLSLGIMIGGFYFVTSNSPTRQNLVHVGASAMTAGEFVAHIKENHVTAYWLGPISGSQYSVDHMTPGLTEVFYTPEGADLSTVKAFTYKVSEYQSEAIYSHDVQPLAESVNDSSIRIDNKMTLSYNRSLMSGELVTYSNHPFVITVAYPHAQTLETMIRTARLLKPVR